MRNCLKRNVLIVALICCATCLLAKNDTTETKKFYKWSVHVAGGYALPFAQVYIGSDDHYNDQNMLTQKILKGSYGQGVYSHLTVGYQITDHIDVRLGAFANWGTELRVKHYTSEVFPNNYNDVFAGANTAGATVGMTLSQQFSKCKIGLGNYLLVGMYNKGYQRNHYGDDNDESTWIVENTKGLSWGLNSALSFDYYFTNRISAGATGFIIIHSWRPKHGEIVKAEYNGVDGVLSMDEEDRNFDYSETVSTPNTNPYIMVYPLNYPLHSAGLKLNCAFYF